MSPSRIRDILGAMKPWILQIWKPFWRIKSRFAKVGMEIGCRLPNFHLKDLQGKDWRLENDAGRKGVLLWLTNLCEGCQEKIPFLERLHQQYEDRVEILAISVLGNDQKTPQEIYQKFRFRFPLLLDPEDWVGNVLQFPHPDNTCPLFNLLMLDWSGLVVFRGHLSAVKEADLEKRIRKLSEET